MSPVKNYAFDVTPARFITGLITERGICDWRRAPALPAAVIHDLNEWRNRLYDAGLVGYCDEHGVGFGNLSIRVDGDEKFIFSGTQTGRIPRTDETHYSLVTACDIGEKPRHLRRAGAGLLRSAHPRCPL